LTAARLPRWPWPWPSLRLSGRIVLVSLALLLMVQTAVFLVIGQSIDRNAHAQLAEHVRLAAQMWQRLLDQRAAKLHQGAALLAADYGMRDAATSGDLETVRSALDNHGARIGASLSALLGTDLAVKAVGEGNDATLAPALARLAPQLAQRPGSGVVALVAQRPYQFVMVPMRAPALIGWVVMGFPLDQALVDDLQAVTGLNAALLAQPMQGAPRVLVHGFRPPVDAAPLVRDLADGDIVIGGQPHLVATTAVASGSEGDPRAGLPRPADRPAEPAAVSRRPAACHCRRRPRAPAHRRADARPGPLQACQRRAGLCLGRPPAAGVASGCAWRCAPAMWWRAWAATSSRCCCRTPTRRRRSAWRSASPQPSSSRCSWTTSAVDLSAGLGIAVWPEHASEADALLSRAEVAMYAAKRQTAGAQVYDPALDTAARRRCRCCRAAPGGRERRAAPVPAAQGRAGRRQPVRRRGAGALAAPHARPGAADAVHPLCRADRLHPPAHAVDVRASRRQQAALAALGVRRVSVNLSTRDLLDPELPDKLEAMLRATGALARGLLPGDHRERHHGRPAARRGHAQPPGASAATSCRSTTSAPAIRRWPT
jgi:hypothetical protein